MLILGIDPGVSGALALLCTRRGLLELGNVPTCSNGTTAATVSREVDARATHELLREWWTRHEDAAEDALAMIERPQAMRGSVTVLSQGDSYGALRAIAGVWAQRIERVNPAEWKRRFGLHGKGKAESVAVARRLYGDALPKRLRNDLAEALLIAHFARMQEA
jgi:hypothetical protein